jgi:ketosteroid isomerase-like protein
MRTTRLKFFLIAVCVLIFGVLPGHAQPNNETAIRNMLAAQVTQWNKGNIAGYMKGYWENDSLLFIGKNGPTYGFNATLQRYRKSYPDAEHMGQLTSTIVNIKELSPQYYFVVGKWHLQRKADELEGSYTLLIKKIKGHWMIVADHSS